MIFSFNKSLHFDKIVIFRSFQQSITELYDISHFKNEHFPFFDRILLGQLEDAASAVSSRKNCTYLAEMFSVELKFTIDTLKAWFTKLIKPKSFELDYDKKEQWKKQNPLTDSIICSICYFPLDPYSDNGWFEHVAKSEHLFLRNMYLAIELKEMGIDDFSEYKENLTSFLDIVNEFEEASQNGEPTDDVVNFMSFDQFFAYDSFADIKDSVNKISLPKRPCFKKQYNFREKAITFLYSNLIRFSSTSKVTAIPISKTFLDNIIAILSNTKCVHHSQPYRH